MSQLSAVLNGYDQVAPFDQGELINLVADYTQVDPATVDYNRARDYILEFEPNVDAIEYSPLRTALEGAGVDFTSTYILNDDVYGIANELVERGLLTQEEIDWTALPEGGQDPERLAYVSSLLPLRLSIPEYAAAYDQALQEGTDNAVTRIDSFFRQVHNGLGPENFINWTPTPVTIPVTVQDSSDIPSDLALAVNALASDVDNITLDSVVGTEQTPVLASPAAQQIIGSPVRSPSAVRTQSPRQAAMLGSLGQQPSSPVRSVSPSRLSPTRLSPQRQSPFISQEPELTTIPAAGLSNIVVQNEVPRSPSPVRLSPQTQVNLPTIPSPGVSNVAITLPQVQPQSSVNLPIIQRQPMSQVNLPTIPSPGVSNIALNAQQPSVVGGQQPSVVNTQQPSVVGGQQSLIPQVNVTPGALQQFIPTIQRQPMSQFQQSPIVNTLQSAIVGGQQSAIVGGQQFQQPGIVDPIGQRPIVLSEGRQAAPTGLGAQQTQVIPPSGAQLQAQQVNATMLSQGLRPPLSSVVGQQNLGLQQQFTAQRPLIPQNQTQQPSQIINPQQPSQIINPQQPSQIINPQQPSVAGGQQPSVVGGQQQSINLPTIPSPGISNIALNAQQSPIVGGQQPSQIINAQQPSVVNAQQFSLYGAQQQPQRTIVSTRTGGAIPPPAQVVQNIQPSVVGGQQPQGIASQYAVTTAPGTVSRSAIEWIPGPYTPQMFMEGMNIQDIRDYIRSLNPKSRVGRTLEEAATIMANFLNVRPETATTHPFTFTRGRGATSSSRTRQQQQYVLPQQQQPMVVTQQQFPQAQLLAQSQGNVIGQGALTQPFSSTTAATGPVNVQPLPTGVTTTPQRNQLPVAYTTAQRNEPEDVKDLRIALLQAGQQRLRQLYKQLSGANARVGVTNAALVDELISFYNTGRVTAQQLLQGATATVTPTRRSNRLGTGQLSAQQGINPDVLPYYNALQTTPVDQIIQLMRIVVPPYITDDQSKVAYIRNNINDYANVVRSSGRTQPVSKQQLMTMPNVEQFLDMFTDVEIVGMTQAVPPYESRRELVTGAGALTREVGAFIPTSRDCRNSPSNGIDLNNPSSVNVIAVGLLDSYDCYSIQELARGVTIDTMGGIIIMLDNNTLITSPKVMTDIYNLSRLYPQLRSIADAIEAQQRALQGQPQSLAPQAVQQPQPNILRQL
uniref:Uncharacterized protein n=1 Tax=viral metagenome TaxID=1070528 RepID=A0A6C0BPA8_9ZZZZ